jgi:6-pyruvoyltetrahydropterin/6-carboxytetrahydropterin synthase
MKTSITVIFPFEAAHALPLMAEGHKCRRLHGHSYRAEFTLEAKGILNEYGMVCDSSEVRVIVGPIIAKVDHRDLRELEDSLLEAEDVRRQPTAENLARWLWARTAGMLSNGPMYRLVKIRIHETERLWAEVEG